MGKQGEAKYYYSADGSTLGPFGIAELLAHIKPNTLVWREGIEWTNASSVPELADFFKAKQTTSAIAQPIQSLKYLKPKRPVWISLAIIILSISSYFFFFNNDSTPKGENSEYVRDITISIRDRGKINICYINVSGIDKTIQGCITTKFNNMNINAFRVKNMEELINAVKANHIDIAILSENELNDKSKFFEYSVRFRMFNNKEVLVAGVPLGNRWFLTQFNSCIY